MRSLIAIPVLALALAACGGGGDDTAAPSTSSGASASSASASPSPSPSEPQEPTTAQVGFKQVCAQVRSTEPRFNLPTARQAKALKAQYGDLLVKADAESQKPLTALFVAASTAVGYYIDGTVSPETKVGDVFDPAMGKFAQTCRAAGVPFK